MAIDARGLASGFGQGFGMADQYYARQNQQERQGKADDRADRSMEMREEQFGMQQQQFELQMEDNQRARNDKRAMRIYEQGIAGIMPPDEELKWMAGKPMYLQALNPAIDETFDVAQRVIDPNDPLDFNSKEGLYAMNTAFGPMINRGGGGRKSIVRGLPGKKEGTMTFDLEIEREDGTKYNEPMTSKRGVAGEDDEVMQVPVGDLTDTMQGWRTLRNAIRTGGASEFFTKMHTIMSGKGATKGININGMLVDPTVGGVGAIGDYRTPDQRQGTNAGKLNPKQEVFSKRLQSEVDHLWRMRREIETGQSDGLSVYLGGQEETITPDNKSRLLKEISDRITENGKELNKLLGIAEPTPVESSIVERAQQVPEADRSEFLADLKANPRTPYRVVQQVEQMFGAGQPSQQGAQQAPQSAPSQQQQPGLQRPQPKPAPQPKPEAGQPMGLRGPETETPNQPMGLRNPNEDRPFMKKRLGPAIEAGFEAVGDWYTGAKAKERNERRMTLLEISDGKKPFSGNRQALLQFLVKSRGEIRDLQPAQLKRLKSQLGPKLAARFLNAN